MIIFLCPNTFRNGKWFNKNRLITSPEDVRHLMEIALSKPFRQGIVSDLFAKLQEFVQTKGKTTSGATYIVELTPEDANNVVEGINIYEDVWGKRSRKWVN